MADGTRDDWRILGFGIGAGVVLVLLFAASFAIGYNLGQSDERRSAAAASTAPTAAPTTTGREASDQALTLFGEKCGSCHTLNEAGTSGMVGPDLDDLKPSKAQVLAAIENGGLGSGTMPPNVLQGAEAERVAEAVSSAAGG